MAEKTTMEKLRILLPHWIEHNHNHGAEFKKWADMIKNTEKEQEIINLIAKAINTTKEMDDVLVKILQKLGGTAKGSCHHHDHK